MNLDNVSNEEMLQLIRADRPHQTIHKVYSFKKSEDYDFYEVEVDKQNEAVYNDGVLFFPQINHVKVKLVYPLSELKKLSEKEQKKATFEMFWGKNFYTFPPTITPSADLKTEE